MARRPLSKPRKIQCDRLTFKISLEDEVGIIAEAFDPQGRDVGRLDTEYFTVKDVPKSISVVSINVAPGARRCGVGTQLYEMVARRACQKGFRLRSDQIRTPAAEGFWKKQERKGRVVCLGPKDPPHRGCSRYEIKKCPVRSLRGKR